ncbi:MAG: hypothetical protein SPL13_05395 [Clostridia bacterium]|nr:hypothetical protein [Clostridia bacterium]
MQFETPTTIEGLYSILNDIFNYYRLQGENFNAADLRPLNLVRMTFTPLTDEQLLLKASENVAGAQEERLIKYKDSLTEKSAEVKAKIVAAQKQEKIDLAANAKTYSSAKSEINKRALKTGTTDSGVYAERLSELEKERCEKAAKISSGYQSEISELTQKFNDLQTLLDSAEQKYSGVCESEVTKEFNRLKEEQDKTEREVFEYNNLLDEKEQRYENTRKQNVANMQLRHMEIRAAGFTKDELVQRGYYADVIKCVTDYYNQMTVAQAFSSIKNEPKLALYLDDYYQSIVYFYRVNAGE